MRAWFNGFQRRRAVAPDLLRCPQCFNPVPIGSAACARCDRAMPPIFAVPERPRSIPITQQQRARLRLTALLLAFGPLTVWVGLGLIFFIQQQTWDTFPVFMLVGLLFVIVAAPIALRFWGDAGGAVLEQSAYLLDLISLEQRSARSATTISYYAAFSQLGRFEVPKAEFDRLALGERYQLSYSPRSRKLWAIRAG
jgi:hypothetical protein